MAVLTPLTGWGRAGRAWSEVVHVDPADAVALKQAVADAGPRGVIARGLGRSYGDPAQNSGARVIQCVPGEHAVALDAEAGTVTVAGGVSLAQVLEVIVPRGWFVPVTPGTRYVTIGGAVASDVHGKNHHRVDRLGGSFGNHVLSLRLMLADMSVVEVGPDRDPDLFWATVGGMGLTGVILSVTFRVFPIETSLMSVDTRRIGDLDEIMAYMTATDSGAHYSVAWIDLLARGRHLGRGVVTDGRHATYDELHPAAKLAPLEYTARLRARVPRAVPPGGVINRLSVAAFNEAWYRKAPRVRDGQLHTIHGYFHPLDMVADWNHLYGRRGFVQYQFVVPDGREDTLRAVIERMSAARVPTFLTVLKRFGPGNPGMLSFPIGGWTLAIDVGAGHPGLADLLRGFDRVVLEAGGRHYLAKDFHTTPEAIRRGYPRLTEWQEVRRRVDPHGVWASDLARRLALTD